MTFKEALYKLLLSLFGADELRRWIRHDHERRAVADELPEGAPSKSVLVHAVIEALEHRGLVNARLFSELRRIREHRVDEIDQVEALWKNRPRSSQLHPPQLDTQAQAVTLTSGSSMDKSVDVLIITAAELEDTALLAVTDGAASRWSAAPSPPGYAPEVYRAEFESLRTPGATIRVLTSRPARMNADHAAQAAGQLFAEFKPRCIAMCGVCAGRPEWTQLGDVIIGERLWRYDSGERFNNVDGGTGRLRKDSEQYQLSAQWLRAAEKAKGWASWPAGSAWLDTRPRPLELQCLWVLKELAEGRDPLNSPNLDTFCADWTHVHEQLEADGFVDGPELTEVGRKHITRSLYKHRNRLPEQPPWAIDVGPLGTGTNLVRDVDIWEQLEDQQRLVRGFDMEAAVIGQTGWATNIPSLAVKGVMDYALPERHRGFRPFAARAAAEVLMRLLRTLIEPATILGAAPDPDSTSPAIRSDSRSSEHGAAELPSALALHPSRGPESDLRHYYNDKELRKRPPRDPDTELIRASLKWVKLRARGALPVVIERAHLMNRDTFPSAQMAIVLLQRAPHIETRGGRSLLKVDLRDQNLGIYNNAGKKFLHEHFLQSRAAHHRDKLREHGRRLYHHLLEGTDDDVPLLPRGTRIPYRWASGGVVPLVRWRQRWWCALFWRDIPPVGWNIANGASERKEEYKDLEQLLWREAREELVILDRDPIIALRDRDFVSQCPLIRGAGVESDVESLSVHRSLREEEDHWRFHPSDPLSDTRMFRPVPGPHSVEVVFHVDEGDVGIFRTNDVVLTINPLEFGIEVIKVGTIHLEDDDYLVDGEVLERADELRWLVRRPVALFSIDALHREWMAKGSLGVEADGVSSQFEGMQLHALSPLDLHVFDADIIARGALRDTEMSRWLAEFGASFEALRRGESVPSQLRTLCPTTWRALETMFACGMLSPDILPRTV